MICELCGSEVARTKPVRIEGTELNVCGNCARFGTESAAPPPRKSSAPPIVADRLARRQRRMTQRDVFAASGPEELAIDYASRIRDAREAHGWTQADLGAKVNERVTIISKVESGAMVPNDGLTKRLERALDIRLREKPEAVTTKAARKEDGITLGDLLDLERP